MTTYEKTAMRVAAISVAGNVLLSGFKLFAGLFAGSAAMVSDAVHSLADVLSTFVVIAGLKLGGREADADHQFGHERIECVSAIILAAVLCVTGAGIGLSAGGAIIASVSGNGAALQAPGALALFAAAVSIILKECLFRYTSRNAKKLDSAALMAQAGDHRSDAFATTGVFVGILGARLGLPVLDPAAGVVISLLIVKSALGIFKEAVDKMTDKACDIKLVEQIRATALRQEMVTGVDELKTRVFGSKAYVEIEIGVDGELPLKVSHSVAEIVHDEIEAAFPSVKHCTVHVNPK